MAQVIGIYKHSESRRMGIDILQHSEGICNVHITNTHRLRLRRGLNRQEVIQGNDLSGKVAIVTGGYSGIGLETAQALASAGAKVIVPARDLDRARKALEPHPDWSLNRSI